MTIYSRPWDPEEGRLHGEGVFLAASLDDDSEFLEEAFISLVRAVFAGGGRLAIGAEPSLVALAALIAAEYVPPRYVETGERPDPATGMLSVYVDRWPETEPEIQQSDLYEAVGAATFFVWADDRETFIPKRHAAARGRDWSPGSIRDAVRHARPRATVALGASEAVLAQAEQSEGPVFVVMPPAAERPFPNERAVDLIAQYAKGEIATEVGTILERFADRDADERQRPRRDWIGDWFEVPGARVPLAFIMQRFVADLGQLDAR
ncbi:MAG: hypothetical protein GXP35_03595 [Actinobacteria bacterium]|nr:hypothetical protein [Actinomycetota bacterium]